MRQNNTSIGVSTWDEEIKLRCKTQRRNTGTFRINTMLTCNGGIFYSFIRLPPKFVRSNAASCGGVSRVHRFGHGGAPTQARTQGGGEVGDRPPPLALILILKIHGKNT